MKEGGMYINALRSKANKQHFQMLEQKSVSDLELGTVFLPFKKKKIVHQLYIRNDSAVTQNQSVLTDFHLLIDISQYVLSKLKFKTYKNVCSLLLYNYFLQHIITNHLLNVKKLLFLLCRLIKCGKLFYCFLKNYCF